jgi:beta-glucosidase
MKRTDLMRVLFIILLVVSCWCSLNNALLRASLPHIHDTVWKKINEMTLTEKVRQLDMYDGGKFLEDAQFSPEKAAQLFGKDGIGVIHDFYPRSADITNEIQKWVQNYSTSGVPVLFIEECLHGLTQQDHTIFPQSISMGATFNPDLMRKVGAAIARETRAYGIHFCLGPVAEPAREPRWGRVEETFGEDPYHAARFAAAYVQGFQGDNLASNHSVVAEPKHFVGYSFAEGGRNTAPAPLGMRELHTNYLPIFKAAVQEGKALGIMAAYSEVDGIPNARNNYLLSDVLRSEFGFKGFVLSDLGAINFLENIHRTAKDPKDAIKQYLEAGGNMQFYDYDHNTFQNGIIEMVKSGEITQDLIDRRVAEVLHVKHMLGLFDNPLTNTSLVSLVVNSEENQNLAVEAARQSIVLVKNTNGVLPLPTDLKRVLVCGPSASEARLGDYSGGGSNINNWNIVSLLQGVLSFAGVGVQVDHVWGTTIQNDNEMYPIHWIHLKHPDGTRPGLQGEYFKNTDLSGDPVFVRYDAEINFIWYHYSADFRKIPGRLFSARWTGSIIPDATVNGTIGLDANGDVARLYIDNVLILETPKNSLTNYSFVKDKLINFRVEYKRNTGQSIQLTWNLVGKNGIADAVAAAKKADAIIVAVGEDANTVGEGHDRVTLDLPGRQHELIKALHTVGKPIILVQLNGRPLSLPWEYDNIDGIIEAYFPGQAQGIAIAEVIFGRYNPGGRLPMTVPKTVGQTPVAYNRKPSSHAGYVTMDANPLLPFGHGLSYTTFTYSDLKISSPSVKKDGVLNITLMVKNNGSRTGDEVVQLYIRDDVSSVTTPDQMLRGFKRITLEPGASQMVQFDIVVTRDLPVFGLNMKWEVEPGLFLVKVGSSSTDIRLTGKFVVTE